MNTQYQEIFRQLARPLEPIATSEAPIVRKLPDVRAVMFDVYGTLLTSASGDVGTDRLHTPAEAFLEAIAACGIAYSGTGRAAADRFFQAIEHEHEEARKRGTEYPEVEITDIWRETLSDLAREGLLPDGVGRVQTEQLAIHYEARANPAWPMPHMADCLAALRSADFPFGIISNAQFFTLELFPALLDKSIQALGFADDLQYYSFHYREAKPGERMYLLARQSLARRGIAAGEVLYVGNDMLNDIWPASKVGFRTALFAGDARSLRRRQGDPRIAGVTPDLVLTDWADLGRCLEFD